MLAAMLLAGATAAQTERSHAPEGLALAEIETSALPAITY